MNKSTKPASVPRGAADATPAQASSGQPAVPWWISLRQGLKLASQLVVASPVRLPPQVVTAATYVSLALGIWEGLTGEGDASPTGVAPSDPEAGAADAP